MNTVSTMLNAAHRGLLDFVKLYPEGRPNYWKNFIGRTMTTKELYEEIATISGFRPAIAMSDGGGVSFDTLTSPYQKKFYPTIYHLGWERTPKAQFNDPYGVIRGAKGEIAKSIYIAHEQSAASVVNNATNSAYLGIDGVVLASASHPTSSTTFSNLSTAAALSISSLEQMYTDVLGHQAYRDYNYFPVSSFNLTVTKENIVLAQRLVQSMKQPQTANNDTNVIRGYINNVDYNPFFTSTTAYILTPSDPSENGLFLLEGMPLTIWEDQDINVPSYKTLVMKEWTFGWTKPQGIQYNAGA